MSEEPATVASQRSEGSGGQSSPAPRQPASAERQKISSWPAPPAPLRKKKGSQGKNSDRAKPAEDEPGAASEQPEAAAEEPAAASSPDAAPPGANLRASEIRDLLSGEAQVGASQADDGMRLGAYRLEAIIGEGAMGHVYRGEHVLLQRKVAIKVLRSELTTDPDTLDRFFAEARAVAALGHPNIVEVTDFVREEDGPTYYVMELLRGEDLASLRSRRRVSLAEAMDIALQLCDALQAVHAAGIVHRDVKPENIFIDMRGDHDVAKLLDFGVAKLTILSGEAVRDTTDGLVVGTPAYMAPEQACGDPVDHRTDLYALGVVLFELVTGRLPFDRESLRELVHEVVHTPAPQPSEVADLPEACRVEIDILLGVCLAKNPSQRPQSAAELADGLRSIALSLERESLDASGLRPSRRPSGIFEDKAEPSVAAMRRPGRIWKPIAAVFVLVVLATGWYFGTNDTSAPSDAPSAGALEDARAEDLADDSEGSRGTAMPSLTELPASDTAAANRGEDPADDSASGSEPSGARSNGKEDARDQKESASPTRSERSASASKASERDDERERARRAEARERRERRREQRLSRRRAEATSRAEHDERSASRERSSVRSESSASSTDAPEPPTQPSSVGSRDDVLNPFD